MKLKVCIAGATGWVGKPLCLAVAKAEDLSLVGAVARRSEGANLRDVVDGVDLDLIISGSVSEALNSPTDVLVDYTRTDAVKANVLAAIRRRVHVVIGTSGLTEEDFAEIDSAARDNGVGVIAAGNFAITAALLQRFACEAAKYLSHWEMVDYASDRKVDAPSGTARELAFRLSEIKEPEVAHPVAETVGPKESRGATLGGSQVHSLRLPGYVIALDVIFGEPDERLTLRYEAGTGAAPYIPTTLLAIRRVKDYVGLIRGLDKIME
ncbi:MAG TPA: 4-hydroxy-tetrahydrodipicolinate reductase [Pyrinomonadaceae bacterium]|jgi:4-hydroxy-tetrahydrodipicolinate reductase